MSDQEPTPKDAREHILSASRERLPSIAWALGLGATLTILGSFLSGKLGGIMVVFGYFGFFSAAILFLQILWVAMKVDTERRVMFALCR